MSHTWIRHFNWSRLVSYLESCSTLIATKPSQVESHINRIWIHLTVGHFVCPDHGNKETSSPVHYHAPALPTIRRQSEKRSTKTSDIVLTFLLRQRKAESCDKRFFNSIRLSGLQGVWIREVLTASERGLENEPNPWTNSKLYIPNLNLWEINITNRL